MSRKQRQNTPTWVSTLLVNNIELMDWSDYKTTMADKTPADQSYSSRDKQILPKALFSHRRKISNFSPMLLETYDLALASTWLHLHV